MNSPHPTIGIQGGEGSFNQAALEHLLKTEQCPEDLKSGVSIDFLFRTQKVLDALRDDRIDWGMFAVWNTTTRVVVEETAEAIKQYGFEIKPQAVSVLESIGFPLNAFPTTDTQSSDDLKMEIELVFSIPIQHYLMRLPDISADRITTIMAHPQVLGQCKKNLDQLLPALKRTSGEGDQFDTATASKSLVDGQLEPNTYILGPKVLAEIYGLTIDMEHPFNNEKTGLQDDENNATYFALVKKYKSSL